MECQEPRESRAEMRRGHEGEGKGGKQSSEISKERPTMQGIFLSLDHSERWLESTCLYMRCFAVYTNQAFKH